MKHYVWITFILVCLLIFSWIGEVSPCEQTTNDIKLYNSVRETQQALMQPTQSIGSMQPTQSIGSIGSIKSFAKKLGGNSNDCNMGETITGQRPDNLEIY